MVIHQTKISWLVAAYITRYSLLVVPRRSPELQKKTIMHSLINTTGSEADLQGKAGTQNYTAEYMERQFIQTLTNMGISIFHKVID